METPRKRFVWSLAQTMMAIVPILGVVALIVLPKYYLLLVVLTVVVTVGAIWRSGHELAEAQNRAADADALQRGIHRAVRATNDAPATLRGETLRLSNGMSLFMIELYKAETVPAPAWSSDHDTDFAALCSGFEMAAQRRARLLQGSEFVRLSQAFIGIRGQLLALWLPDGQAFLTQNEMSSLTKLSTEKDAIEEQVKILQTIAMRLPISASEEGNSKGIVDRIRQLFRGERR